MTDEFSCDQCGQSFDSERGLRIHRGRVHKGEDSDEQDTTEQAADQDQAPDQESGIVAQESDGRVSFSLPVFHALGAVFVIGVVFGGFVMGAAAQVGSGVSLSDDAALSLAEAMDDQTGTVGSPSDSGPDTGSQETTDTGSQDTGSSPTVEVSKISLEGEPVLGQSDAEVTLVMYEDFQCPFCRRFEIGEMRGSDNPSTPGSFGEIRNNYVESGQVKVVWKDYPVPQLGHNWAEPSAAAMECVYRQSNDAFWKVKEKVFVNTPDLNESNVQDKIVQWASDEGVSASAVRTCIEEGNPMSEINADKQEGSSFDARVGPRNSPFISGTPSFVIYGSGDDTGTPIVGAQPYSRFQSVIEQKLAG